jgi:hypothetical protein
VKLADVDRDNPLGDLRVRLELYSRWDGPVPVYTVEETLPGRRGALRTCVKGRSGQLTPSQLEDFVQGVAQLLQDVILGIESRREVVARSM